MDRLQFQTLADIRLQEAESLLTAGSWCGAYYLAGYAVECALKACILRRRDLEGLFFRENRFQEKCWSHDIERLVELANLTTERDAAVAENPPLGVSWKDVKDWSERSRYEHKTETQARDLVEAIGRVPHGVLPWLKSHW